MKTAAHRSAPTPPDDEVVVPSPAPERARLEHRARQITQARTVLRQRVRSDADGGQRQTALSRVLDEFTVELHQVQARLAAIDYRSGRR